MIEIAHGIVGRTDLPIPEWLFGWAAAIVLIVSFVALAVLWQEPKLDRAAIRPLARLSAVVSSRPVDVLCGAIGVFLLGVTVWAGFEGVQAAQANFAPTFVFVIVWLGLVAASVLFGDVFRAFNPWRAIGRSISWVARTAARGPMPPPLAYPERLGHWPAAAGIFGFAVLELVVSNGDQPEKVAVAVLVYSVAQFVGMALYGVEEWCDRGEAFGVYFGLFARMSPWGRRDDGTLGLRLPLAGLAEFRALPGTVALLAVMIGSVTFDGAAEGPLWTGLTPDLLDFFGSLGLGPARALEATFLLGLVAAVLLVWGFYSLGIRGALSVGGGHSGRALARAFVASLVPIAFAYVAAHYVTLLLYQGQAIVTIDPNPFGYLASDPLGDGSDFFGTATRTIDYGVIGATAAWYWQVGFVVLGHVAALTVAHDKALTLYSDARQAVRSQYWMLAVMVGFTSLALWLLSQSNG